MASQQIGKYNREFFLIGTAKVDTTIVTDNAHVVRIIAKGENGVDTVELRRECAWFADEDWRTIKANLIRLFKGQCDILNADEATIETKENRPSVKKSSPQDLMLAILKAKALAGAK